MTSFSLTYLTKISSLNQFSPIPIFKIAIDYYKIYHVTFSIYALYFLRIKLNQISY